jgi:excisionase family DNA binding protein
MDMLATVPMAEPLPEYLDAESAAERIGVSVFTIRRWARLGMLKGVRLSDRAGWRFPREEVERVLREGLREPQ